MKRLATEERERERERERTKKEIGTRESLSRSQLATAAVMRSSSEVLGGAESAGQQQQICRGSIDGRELVLRRDLIAK
jgi:hypothetical protein